MEWADAKVWTAFFEGKDGQKDEKLCATFHHLHVVQYAYLRMWQKEPDNMSFPEFDDASSLMRWGQDYYNQVHTYLETFSDEKITKELILPISWINIIEKEVGQRPEMSTFVETMHQVVLHTAHHRGQINTRLRGLGVDPPTVDYITWVWLGRPAVNWPTVTS